MKKSVILILAAFLIASCASEAPEAGQLSAPNNPEVVDTTATPMPTATPNTSAPTDNAEGTPTPDSTETPDVVVPSPTATTSPPPTTSPTTTPTPGRPSPSPHPPRFAPAPTPHASKALLGFNSEKEFLDFMLNEDESSGSERRDHKLDKVTHYYKFKNPPLGATIKGIAPSSASVGVSYDTKRNEANGSPEYMVIMYNHNSINWEIDVETSAGWVYRQFPEESYIIEKEGLKYYICKGIGSDGRLLWAAEWINADGYLMQAWFPYRFTPEEVLGFVSDLERVEIG